MQREAKITQSNLLILPEIVFGISRKGGIVERAIWRIKVDKIPIASVDFAEVPHANVDVLQRRVASPQYLRLAYRRVLVATHRNIELAFGVHAPKAVVAGLVEVDETRRYLDAVVEIVLTSEVVVVFLAVILGVNPELGDERFGVALDDLIGVDEIKINIT